MFKIHYGDQQRLVRVGFCQQRFCNIYLSLLGRLNVIDDLSVDQGKQPNLLSFRNNLYVILTSKQI